MDSTEDKSYIPTLVGGDYLSVTRAREEKHSTLWHIATSDLKENRLDGMIPMAEDWHAKVCLLEVSTYKN